MRLGAIFLCLMGGPPAPGFFVENPKLITGGVSVGNGFSIAVTVADRIRAYRERQRHGRLIFPVEADTFAVADALIWRGFLTEDGAADDKVVDAALRRFIEEE